MKATREALIKHINKIAVGGAIEEVVFTGAFETVAMTQDELLFVKAPPLPKVEPLAEPLGLAELPLIAKGLGTLSGSGNDKTMVHIRIDDMRLILDEQERGLLSFVTADPSTIHSQVEEKVQDGLVAKMPDPESGAPITKSLVDGVTGTFRLLKAQEVTIHVSPEGGKIVVGNEHAHLSEFPHDDLSDGDKSYSLLFGEYFVDILGNITNFTEARLLFTGPSSIMYVTDGSYIYVLSPHIRGDE